MRFLYFEPSNDFPFHSDQKAKSEDSLVVSTKEKPMPPDPIPDSYSTEMHTHVFQKTQTRMNAHSSIIRNSPQTGNNPNVDQW